MVSHSEQDQDPLSPESLARLYRIHSAELLGRDRRIVIEHRGRPYLLELTEERELRLSELDAPPSATAIWRSLAEATSEAMMITDASTRIVAVNPAFTLTTGYTEAEAIGSTPRALLKSGRQGAEFYREMWSQLLSHGTWQGEIWNRRKSGEVYAEWLTINVLRGADGSINHFIAVFSDITRLEASFERRCSLSYYDPLTGLANRKLLLDKSREAMERARGEGGLVALIYLDLDGFAAVNDLRGHHVGDELLRLTGERIRASLPVGGVAARGDADSFYLLLTELDEAGEVESVAERLLAELARPLEVDEKSFSVSASIGGALFPHDAEEVSELLQRTEKALHHARREGGNRFALFSHIERSMGLRDRLPHGIKGGEFTILYQPRVDVSGEVVTVEVLARWEHPTLGLIAPDLFLPLAEKSGLMGELGELLLRTALHQWRRWCDQGVNPLRIALNISREQLDPRLPAVIEQVTGEVGMPMEYLELELGSGSVVSQAHRHYDLLLRLRDLGVRLVVDDFGVGGLPLQLLGAAPIHRLNLDRGLTRYVPDDRIARTVAEVAVELARRLGYGVAAKGVETVEQFTFLHRLGCSEFQGHLFAPAVSGEEFLALWQGRSEGDGDPLGAVA